MSMVYFFVPGKVQGKARPRFSSKSGTVYTPGKTKSYERQIAEAYEAQHGPCFEGGCDGRDRGSLSDPEVMAAGKEGRGDGGETSAGETGH